MEKIGEFHLNVDPYRDMHAANFVELICPHGIGHHKGVHGCDRCCYNAPQELWDKVTTD